jgi:hypothetical protein
VEVKNPMNNTSQRPGDIYMPEFDVFGDAFVDVSVINSCAESYVRRASKGQLEGSGIRYEAKVGKYPELGKRFKPLVVEATGGWHRFSFDYLKLLAEHISTRTNKSSKSALNGLLTSTSFCLFIAPNLFGPLPKNGKKRINYGSGSNLGTEKKSLL